MLTTVGMSFTRSGQSSSTEDQSLGAARNTAAALLRLVLGWRRLTAVTRTTTPVGATQVLWAGREAVTSLFLRNNTPLVRAPLVALGVDRVDSAPRAAGAAVVRRTTELASSARQGRKAPMKRRATAALLDLMDANGSTPTDNPEARQTRALWSGRDPVANDPQPQERRGRDSNPRWSVNPI